MRVGLVQMTSSDDPSENLANATTFVEKAVAGGARFVLTPEVTNCVSASRPRQNEVLTYEADDPTLSALRKLAKAHDIWLLIGSLALKSGDDDRFVNRSLLIAPSGEVAARYDKMHMFDVALSETETYRESDGYKPGDRAVVSHVDGTGVGLTVCYDVRFPYLYRDLAQAGASMLTVPSAFSPDTGPMHWEPLLRARAIETGCFVLAPAQTGEHTASRGRARQTWGHSLAIDPWGRVIADGGTAQGVVFADLDLAMVAQTRRRLPSLTHDRAFRSAGDG